jgi:hypothetical protein
MPQSLRFVKDLTSWMRTQRTKLLVLLLVMALVVPQPTKGQFLPIDLAAIVSAIGAINTAITNVIGAGLRDISSALNAVNGVLNAIQSFFQSTVYPLDAINRARGVVGAVQGFYNVIRGLVNLNVASATLANARQLEAVLLSRNAGNIAQVANRFTTVYQAVPPATDASAPVRDLIDMTDATAQAALKKAIAIDAAADQLMDASDQLTAELAVAAPGTAPMIEAQSAAMLVKAHALTQSATAELFRIRAIDMANTGASLKFNANHASDTRRDLTNMFKK